MQLVNRFRNEDASRRMGIQALEELDFEAELIAASQPILFVTCHFLLIFCASRTP